MIKHKRLLAVLLIFILVVSMVPLTTSAILASVFPFRSKAGELIADDYTKYVTLLKQDPQSKLITATVQIRNSNLSCEPLAIQGLGIGIFFTSQVAPYAYSPSRPYFDPGRLFVGRIAPKSASEIAAFSKYCTPLIPGFNSMGSRLIHCDVNTNMIGALISSVDPVKAPTITVEPGQTIDVIEFYFMPVNGEDALDIDMFSYKYYNETFPDFIRIAPVISNGTCSVQATARNVPLTSTYVVSPNTFKLHARRPAAAVAADNEARLIAGYDAETMEWSDSPSGPYSDLEPSIGEAAQTLYVRIKGDDGYSGFDEMYGDYKKYVAGAPVEVVFDAIEFADAALEVEEPEVEEPEEELDLDLEDELELDEDIELDEDLEDDADAVDEDAEAAASVEINSSNLTSDDGITRPGDVIEYEIKVSNDGDDGSVWVDATLVDAIPLDVTLDESSIETSSGVKVKYDFDRRILSVLLGAIKAGKVKTITFIVVVNDDAYGKIITNSVTVQGKGGAGDDAGGLSLTVEEDGGREVEDLIFDAAPAADAEDEIDESSQAAVAYEDVALPEDAYEEISADSSEVAE